MPPLRKGRWHGEAVSEGSPSRGRRKPAFGALVSAWVRIVTKGRRGHRPPKKRDCGGDDDAFASTTSVDNVMNAARRAANFLIPLVYAG